MIEKRRKIVNQTRVRNETKEGGREGIIKERRKRDRDRRKKEGRKEGRKEGK